MPELESAHITLFGNFNPYLISPEWLDEQEIWNARDVKLALGAVKSDGVLFNGEGTEWFVSSDRLVIASTVLDCGEMALKVLKELPHTPMTAVGANFEFQDNTDERTYPVFEAIRETIPTKVNPQLLRWGVVLHEGGARIEVMLIQGDHGTTLAFNHNRTTASHADACKAVSLFSEDHDRSVSLMKQFLS
ncbi:MAG: hypothetical protein DWQ46_11545 [Planctomycetota bacterium]|nr:MAG: hypothetical protein DWQ46_11545 [Planctomycetota bacterium]